MDYAVIKSCHWFFENSSCWFFNDIYKWDFAVKGDSAEWWWRWAANKKDSIKSWKQETKKQKWYISKATLLEKRIDSIEVRLSYFQRKKKHFKVKFWGNYPHFINFTDGPNLKKCPTMIIVGQTSQTQLSV